MSLKYGFTGEPTDANDLVYLRNRYYNPELGTFLSMDPYEGDFNDPMSLNRYAYVRGNPVNLTDPSGLCAAEDEDCQTYVRGTEAAYGVQVLSDQQSSMRAGISNRGNDRDSLERWSFQDKGIRCHRWRTLYDKRCEYQCSASVLCHTYTSSWSNACIGTTSTEN